MWGLIAGLVSYPAFAWTGHRLLQHFDWKPGFSRVLVVFLIATLLSSALGSGVSWILTPPGQQSTQTVLAHKLKIHSRMSWLVFPIRKGPLANLSCTSVMR